jgi:hypothetical protein
MSKKKLDITSITNELRGQSVFFPTKPPPSSQELTQVPSSLPAQGAQRPRELKEGRVPPTKKAHSNHDTVIPRHHGIMQPSNHDTTVPQPEGDIFEVVRKAVKQIGKEAATHRFTLDEKNLLADIEYTYKRQGIRTSENEITRIAINYFIEDYRINGEQSILVKVLKRLNS